jgi:outer membrane protein
LFGRARFAGQTAKPRGAIRKTGPSAFPTDIMGANVSLSYSLTLAVMLAVSTLSCTLIPPDRDPDVAPSTKVDRSWIAPQSVSAAATTSRPGGPRNAEASNGLSEPGAKAYDLPALIDLALRTNPQTRSAWFAALAAQAQLGQSHANDYPKVDAEGTGGYLKLPIEFPNETLVIRNEAFLPQIKVSYDLLDFGRTRAAQRGAREQLIGANFAFNRAIQDVVFNVEKAYYVLSAARASVSAAEANLKLAHTSLGSIQERHEMGLATGPQTLMGKQVEAQAVYDLENAKSMVHDAESGLAQAIGLGSDVPIKVRATEQENIPPTLNDDVEKLIDDAVSKRPDIAAQIAAVRAGNAAIEGAEAEYYPEVEIGGNYGQIIWSYTVNGGPTQNLNQPFYGAMLTLRWDLFTGFDRYYGVQKAMAQRDASSSQLKALKVDVIATVWKDYYHFLSAKKKYNASQALVAASQEAYNANLESHRHGLATITDLIGSERDLMAARFTLVQSRAELLVSSCGLAYAVGAESAPSTGRR